MSLTHQLRRDTPCARWEAYLISGTRRRLCRVSADSECTAASLRCEANVSFRNADLKCTCTSPQSGDGCLDASPMKPGNAR